MNKPEFIQLIQTPDLLSAKHVAALKQVVADFPYFTVSQVLLAKALFNEKHYESEKYLKQTALAVPDREVLYYYLHNLEKKPVVLKQEPVRTPEPVALPVEPVRVEPIPEPVAEEIKPAENIVTIPPIETTVETPEETIPAVTEIVPETDVVEIVAEADPVKVPEAMIEPVVEELPLKEEEINVPVSETLEVEPLSSEPQIPVETEELKPAQPGNEAHSFMEWLQLAGKQPLEKPAAIVSPPAPEPQSVVQRPEIKEEKPEAPAAPLVEVTKEDIEKAVANSNINDFGNILDKFIKENPSISRPKAEFFNPVNMARQSVEEDDELVTETLANLYYKQGNHRKAIRAYEKLCLLYPSKMTYFATLIQKIKTELKD